ncbi:hypothetical protein V5738_10890 [Salinisphaera sp. SPP-AMP-43]|uniref:hypothetical protein n=1 Tax=Salinisphaera sp. SPP-AMP-43 TaxID=3121288 RepID=UPI003C6DFD2C
MSVTDVAGICFPIGVELVVLGLVVWSMQHWNTSVALRFFGLVMITVGSLSGLAVAYMAYKVGRADGWVTHSLQQLAYTLGGAVGAGFLAQGAIFQNSDREGRSPKRYIGRVSLELSDNDN